MYFSYLTTPCSSYSCGGRCCRTDSPSPLSACTYCGCVSVVFLKKEELFFVFLQLFTKWNVLTNALFSVVAVVVVHVVHLVIVPVSSRDSQRETGARVRVCECKRWILSNRENRTEENRLSRPAPFCSFLTTNLTGLCESRFCRTGPFPLFFCGVVSVGARTPPSSSECYEILVELKKLLGLHSFGLPLVQRWFKVWVQYWKEFIANWDGIFFLFEP